VNPDSLVGRRISARRGEIFKAEYLPQLGPFRDAGALVSASAVFTAGVVITVGMSRFEWSALVGIGELEAGNAVGMWLLILATVLAAAAGVVAYLPGWKRATEDWADPSIAYTDTPTPPSGVAITVLPPDAEDDQRP